MDVTCERCGTEYEFDETLLSGRGTSVKCTNCGHVFKVYPKAREDADRSTSTWRLLRADGSVDSIDSLRELQRRIAAGELTPSDRISRGQEAWKPLGSIPELETFFGAAESSAETPTPVSEPDLAEGAEPTTGSPTRRRPRQPTLLGVVPVPKPGDPAAGAPVQAPSPSTAHTADTRPMPAHESARSSARLPEEEPSSAPPAAADSLRLPETPTASRDREIEDAQFEESVPARQRSTPPPYFDDDDDIPELPGRGWSPTRWLILVAIVGALVLVGSQWDRVLQLVGSSSDQESPEVSAQKGDKSLAADHLVAYQSAIESYADALEVSGGQDPSLLVKLSHAHALLAQAINDNKKETKSQNASDFHAKEALNYAERALMISPEALEARLAEADALRLNGKEKQARESLERGRLMPFSRTPEFFRVDSLLLAAEHEGNLEKGLRSAKQAAQDAPDVIRYRLLLARAELAAGNLTGARKEVDAILAIDPAHPTAIVMLAEIEEAQKSGEASEPGAEAELDAGTLPTEATGDAAVASEAAAQAAVEAAQQEATAEAPAVEQAAKVEKKEEKDEKEEETAKSAPKSKTSKPRSTPPRKRSTPSRDEYDRLADAAGSDAFVDGRPPVRDFGWYMREGEAALAGRDYTKATALFESALEVRPGSGDATDALGRVSYASGDYEQALRYFRSAAQRGHPDGYYSLGQAYEKLGKSEEAVSAYYTYLKRRPSGSHVAAARSAIKKLEPRVKLPEPQEPAPKADSETKTPTSDEENTISP